MHRPEMVFKQGTSNDPCERIDVAIIGAGIGGLTAGALLSKAGLRCTVFEAESQPGGYLAGFTRGGFRFDSSVQWFSQCGEGAFVSTIWNHIGTDRPVCPTLHEIQRYKGAGYDYSVTTDSAALCSQWERDFPECVHGIRAFHRDAKKLAKRLALLNNHIRSPQSMKPPEQFFHGLRMLHLSAPLIPYAAPPVETNLRRYFKSPGLRNVFCSQESFLAVMVPFSWAISQNFQSAPTGGASAVIDWLGSKSSVRTNARVKHIFCDDHKTATGLELADGTTVQAKHIIAACDIQHLYRHLLPPGTVPPRLLNAVDEMELYTSSFSIFLGLDCLPSDLGFSKEMTNLTSPLAKTRAAHSSGKPDESILMIMSPSLRNPEMAPEGKGTLMIHCPALFDYENRWQTGEGLERGEKYYALKERFAHTLLNRVEESFPGLKEHIEVMTTASPITYWRFTGNAKGTILGSKPCGKNFRNRVAHYRTPIKNVLVGGHCAEYGGGVPLATKAGANAALIVLKDIGHPAYAELKALMDGTPVS